MLPFNTNADVSDIFPMESLIIFPDIETVTFCDAVNEFIVAFAFTPVAATVMFDPLEAVTLPIVSETILPDNARETASVAETEPAVSDAMFPVIANERLLTGFPTVADVALPVAVIMSCSLVLTSWIVAVAAEPVAERLITANWESMVAVAATDEIPIVIEALTDAVKLPIAPADDEPVNEVVTTCDAVMVST